MPPKKRNHTGKPGQAPKVPMKAPKAAVKASVKGPRAPKAPEQAPEAEIQELSNEEYSDEFPFSIPAGEKKSTRLRSNLKKIEKTEIEKSLECKIPVLESIQELEFMAKNLNEKEKKEENLHFFSTKNRWNGKFASENFFLNSESKNFCEKNSDSNLEEMPILDFCDEEFQLKKYRSENGPKIFPDFSSEFKKWFFLLAEGFNLIFYGFGSKIEILENFSEKFLSGFSILKILGYKFFGDQKEILLEFAKGLEIDDKELIGGRFEEEALFQAIKQKLAAKEAPDVFLIIQNIDGPEIRSQKMQFFLAKLAKIPKIHILASIDHPKASLIWSQSQISALNFLWIKTNTGIPYNLELQNSEFGNKCKGIFAQSIGFLGDRKARVHSLQSLESIWASLNENAKKIFQLLVENYFANIQDGSGSGMKARNEDGMEFWDLYRKCRDQFLVFSETALRTQLVEFRDHEILQFKRSPGGLEYLVIGLDRELLSEFCIQLGLIEVDQKANHE